MEGFNRRKCRPVKPTWLILHQALTVPAGESVAIKFLVPADRDADAGLIVSIRSLEAGHSVWDQVLKVERSPFQSEGFARHRFRRIRESAGDSAVPALEHSCF